MSEPPSDGFGRTNPPPTAPAATATPRDGDEREAWVAVLGVGQLGGSLALAGRAAGLFRDVVGFGRNVESLRRARALGLCDRTTTSAAEAVAGAGTVILATPLRSVPGIVDAIAPVLAAGTLVIDVGSVKGTAVRDIELRLPASVAFVPCHPLAGTERFGPEAATADLFRGRRCIVCPTPATSQVALDRARSLWLAVGAEVVTMRADLHDHVMARVSHLPHVAAYALAGALGSTPEDLIRAARGLPTSSLRDTVRVAASSPAMWADIFVENRAALLPLVDELATRLAEIRGAIARDDVPGLVALLEAARASRAKIMPV